MNERDKWAERKLEGEELRLRLEFMRWFGEGRGVRHNLAVDEVGIEMSWRLEID